MFFQLAMVFSKTLCVNLMLKSHKGKSLMQKIKKTSQRPLPNLAVPRNAFAKLKLKKEKQVDGCLILRWVLRVEYHLDFRSC